MKPWEIDHTISLPDAIIEESGKKSEPEDDDEMMDSEGGESEEVSQTRYILEGKSKRRARGFEEILEKFKFEGSFLQTERYSVAQASNPCLEIDGIGLIGLPLSADDARALLLDNRPMGLERLEIPAEKVRFTNPEWNAWFQKEAGVVCTALSGKRVKPVFTLKKLVLEGTDPQVQQTPSNEAIATLIIVLPSTFEGGDMLFDHGVLSKTIRLAPQSHLLTSFVAAYSIVKSKMGAITSGYRLSLHYDVHRPETDALAIPSFPDMEDANLALRQAMVEWKEDGTGKAKKLRAYFLKRKYPWKRFTLQLLTGPDALLMAHLAHLATELDFQLYVVQARLSCFGIGKGYDGPRDKLHSSTVDWFETADNWEDTDERAYDMHSVPVTITGFDSKDDLDGDIDDVAPDEEYEDLGDENWRIDQTFQRAFFLLWPNKDSSENPVEVQYSVKYACYAVNKSFSNPPTTREKILAESLSARCEREDEKKDSTRGLSKVAEAQNDVHLLLRTLQKNGAAANLDLIGIEQCVSAYRKFGWEPMKFFFDEAVNKDVSNPRRQALLAQLSQAAGERLDSEVVAWCEEKQDLVPQALARASIAEVDWLLDLASIHGADFMRTIVYPQLKAQQLESEFWVHFVRRLENHVAAGDLGKPFARACVEKAADNLLCASPNERAGDSWGYGGAEPTKKAGLIIEVFRLSVEAACTAVCSGIFERMKRAADKGTLSSAYPAWECYAELAHWLHEYLAPLPDPTAVIFRPFFADAVGCMLAASSPERIAAYDKTFDACVFEEENLSIIVIAAKRAGGPSFLKDCDMKVVMAGRDSKSLEVLINHLIAELRPPPDDITTTAEYTTAINSIVGHAIDIFDTKAFQPPDGPMGKSARSMDEIIDMFKFCSSVGMRSEWPHLLAHLETPPPGVKMDQHVSKVLTPLLPALRDYLASQSLDLETDPFKAFSTHVLEAFANSVMGQRPGDVVGKIGCERSCKECDSLRAFFASDRQSISFKRMTHYAREHMEKQLATPKSWGVTFKVKNSKDLEITKPDSIMAAGLTAENQKRGLELLVVLGNEAAQRHILGSNYKGVFARISGQEEAATKRKAADEGGASRTKKGRSS